MANGEQFQIPANRAYTITPSDGTTFDPPLRRLYVGGTGNVVITTRGGDTVTLSAVPVGTQIRDVFISKVNAATTATLIVGFR